MCRTCTYLPMLMDFKALFEESGVWSRQWKWRKDDASSLLTMRTLALLVFAFWLSIVVAPTLLSPATVTVSVLEHSPCVSWWKSCLRARTQRLRRAFRLDPPDPCRSRSAGFLASSGGKSGFPGPPAPCVVGAISPPGIQTYRFSVGAALRGVDGLQARARRLQRPAEHGRAGGMGVRPAHILHEGELGEGAC